MDPRTGAIKAMANYPTFNPNNPASLDEDNRRNFAISDMIEPGSTFKLVTAIAAVEQDKVQFDEKFKTPEDGKIKIHGQWMRDHDPLGTLRFPEVIEKSSNVATAQIGHAAVEGHLLPVRPKSRLRHPHKYRSAQRGNRSPAQTLRVESGYTSMDVDRI
ncbi:MAG: penicillin-binding transpeptidase domain-containing protein [Fodinibius sp.]|nr:penicillin-binding transpeptidase domain-containing protein [Fodinibius sp.]